MSEATRSVDYVDRVVIPRAERGSRLDGDALLSLEIHAIHRRADAVLAADLGNACGESPLRVLCSGEHCAPTSWMDLIRPV